MAKKGLFRFLSRFVDLKPGEEVIALQLFFYFFLITSSYSIIKSVRNARYLIDREARQLPLAYLLAAILIGFIVAFHSKLQVKIPRALLVLGSFIFFILSCFLFFWLFLHQWTWVPVVFWVWASIFITVLMTQFWILVNDIFNPREARRLIGFLVSGGILGGILGGLATGVLGRTLPDHLLIIPCGLLISNIVVVNSIFIRQKRAKITSSGEKDEESTLAKELKRFGFRDCFQVVKKNYYLKLLSAVLATTLIVSLFIDWQANQIIEIHVDQDDYTTFFGFFYAGLLILPFFLQLFLASNLIKRYGIRLTSLIYPLLLLVCSAGIALAPSLFFAVLIKGSDKSLSFSINQSVRELLYIPISPQFKYKAKIFIDMFLGRFAEGIGALILMLILFLPLGLSSLTPADPGRSPVLDLIPAWNNRVRLVSAASVVFILAWVFFNLKATREYTNTVKQRLEMKWERADKIVEEKLDLGFMKHILNTLEDKNRSSTLYAMDVFDLIRQRRLSPEVKKLIGFYQDDARASSLGTLVEGGANFIPDMEDYLDDKDLGKEISEIMTLDVYQEVMKGYINRILTEESKNGEVAKMEVAKAVGLMSPQSPLAQKLEELLLDSSPDVIRYALESASRLKRREYVPALVQSLLNPRLRDDACAALEKYGPKVIGTLSDYLNDEAEAVELRKAIASILSRIGSQEAADFLLLELAQGCPDLRSELIDALDHIRSREPQVQFSKDLVIPCFVQEMKNFYQMFLDFHDLQPGQSKFDLNRGLPPALNQSLLNIFRLMGLIYSHDAVVKAYQNIKTGTAHSVAYAIELLDNLLPKDMRDVILPIIEDLPLEARIRSFRNLIKTAIIFKKN